MIEKLAKFAKRRPHYGGRAKGLAVYGSRVSVPHGVAGVYVLIVGESFDYIGMSADVRKRLLGRCAGIERIAVIAFEGTRYQRYNFESDLIKALKPTRNVDFKNGSKVGGPQIGRPTT